MKNMAAVCVLDSCDYKPSKVDILRGIVTETLTTAVREILAVVETTVEGYENEVLLLKRELDHHKGQLRAVLQPQVTLCRTGLGDAERRNTVILASTDQGKEVLRHEHKDAENAGCPTTEICMDKLAVITEVSHGRKPTTENRCSAPPVPSKDEIDDDQNKDTHPKRTRRLPKRYRTDHDGTDSDNCKKLDTKKNREKEWKSQNNKKQQSSHEKKQEQRSMFQESEALNSFISFKQLRVTLPQLNPFEGFLADSGTKSPLLENNITLNAAIKSTEKGPFDLKPEEHKETSGAVTETPTALHDDMPSTSNLEMQPPREVSQSTDEPDHESEEDEDDDGSDDGILEQEQENTDTADSEIRTSCKVCGIKFRNQMILTKHAQKHLDDHKNICAVCGQQVDSSELHLQSHRWYKPFKCNTCPKAYWQKINLVDHIKKHKGQQPVCDVCNKVLADWPSLCRHKLIHKGVKNHSCQHCGKCFYTITFLKRHEKIHTDREKSHLCHICSKTFYDIGALKIHLGKHEGKYIYNCPVCNKPIKGTLRRHMMIHRGEKPFSCSVCGLSFVLKSNLDMHMRIHTDIRPFKCKMCEYSCKRKHHLILHMRTHTGNKPFKCTLCDQAYTQSHCLKKHMKSHQADQS